jgi:hypothetical protein
MPLLAASVRARGEAKPLPPAEGDFTTEGAAVAATGAAEVGGGGAEPPDAAALGAAGLAAGGPLPAPSL